MIFLTFYITSFLKISRKRSSEMEIDYRRTGESVSLHSKIFFSCIYTARKKRLRRMSRPRRRKGFCGSCEARCTPISNQKRRRFVESVHRFGETPFKFDTPDLGRDRRTRYGSKSISRLSRIHCRLFLRSIIYSWNRGRIHACCGKETGREEGWKSVNERSSVLRRSVDFAENAWNREKFTADAPILPLPPIFLPRSIFVSRLFLIEFE